MNYHKGFIVPLLLIIIAILVVGSGAYVYTNKQPSETEVVSPTTQSTSTAQTPNSQAAKIKTFTNTQGGFEFKYSHSLDFQPVSGTDIIQAEVKSGLPSESHIDSVRISIRVDRTKSRSESCMPEVYPTQPGEANNIAERVQAGDNLFYKYYSPNLVGCTGFQCDGGRLYTHWFNNACYQVEYSYSSDYLEKIFSCSPPGPNGISKSCTNESDYPKYVVAKQSQSSALEYVDSLAFQIIASFKVNP